jgi:hypothetical protein
LLSRSDAAKIRRKEAEKKARASFILCCELLDQNSPAPRTRAASHQEKTPTQRLIMRQKIQCGGDRVPLSQHPLIAFSFFKSLLPRCCGLCFKHSQRARYTFLCHYFYWQQQRASERVAPFFLTLFFSAWVRPALQQQPRQKRQFVAPFVRADDSFYVGDVHTRRF